MRRSPWSYASFALVSFSLLIAAFVIWAPVAESGAPGRASFEDVEPGPSGTAPVAGAPGDGSWETIPQFPVRSSHSEIRDPLRDRLILFGGSNRNDAWALSLVGDCELEKVYAVGNAAGDGARIALLNVEKRNEIDAVTRRIERFELPTDPEFQNQFMLATSFPHMSEPFEHIAHLIPDRTVDPMAKNFMK